jgi:hypothetical protein
MTPEQIQSAIDDFVSNWQQQYQCDVLNTGDVIRQALTQALEIVKGDKVVVSKSDVARAMLPILRSPAIVDTIMLDGEIMSPTLFEHLAIIGKIDFDDTNYEERLKDMIAVVEEDK